MTAEGTDGRWWRNLQLPLLEPESGLCAPWLLCSRLGEELAVARRDGAPVSVLLVEGRPPPGQRLRPVSVRAAARALATVARETDVPGRLGPRTFALLLPGVKGFSATQVGQLLEQDLEATTASSGDHWRVSCLAYPSQEAGLERLAAGRPDGHLREPRHHRRKTAA